MTWKPCARHVGDAAAERVLGREGDRVDEEVELAPVGGDALEDRFELAVGHHVHRHEDRRLDLAGQRLDVRLRLLVEVGDRELGAEGAEGAGAAPGDRAVVGDADDQALAAFEELRLDDGKRHAVLRFRRWPARRRARGCGGRSSAPRRSGRRGGRRGSPGVEMRGRAGLVGGRVELGAEPGEALGDAGADRRGVLADAGGEDEGVEAAEGGGEAAGVQRRSGGRSGRWRRRRRDRRSPAGRACRWRRPRGP